MAEVVEGVKALPGRGCVGITPLFSRHSWPAVGLRVGSARRPGAGAWGGAARRALLASGPARLRGAWVGCGMWERGLLPILAWPRTSVGAASVAEPRCFLLHLADVATCKTGTREKLQALVDVCCALVGANVIKPQTKKLLECHPKFDINTLISEEEKEAGKFGVVRAEPSWRVCNASGLTGRECSVPSFRRWELSSISFYPLQNAPHSLPSPFLSSPPLFSL